MWIPYSGLWARRNFEYAIHFEAEVVVARGGVVLLYDKAEFTAAARLGLAFWFGRFTEGAFTEVFAESHV